MPPETAQQAKCIGCGFQARAGSDEWNSTDLSPFGTMTTCPDCGSTDVHVQ